MKDCTALRNLAETSVKGLITPCRFLERYLSSKATFSCASRMHISKYLLSSFVCTTLVMLVSGRLHLEVLQPLLRVAVHSVHELRDEVSVGQLLDPEDLLVSRDDLSGSAEMHLSTLVMRVLIIEPMFLWELLLVSHLLATLKVLSSLVEEDSSLTAGVRDGYFSAWS